MLTVQGTGSSALGDLGTRTLAALHNAGIDIVMATQVT